MVPPGILHVIRGGGGMRRQACVLATVTGIMLLAAGCGGGSSTVTTALTAYQKALAYAQCMRSHGVPRFPDPDSRGNFAVSPSEIGPVNGAQFRNADKACRHLLPGSQPMTPAQERQATAQALRFVACMRSHGLPHFPDPVVNAQGIGFRVGGNGDPRPSSPQFKAAQQACQKLMPGGPP
jgi:hypothetical protein